MKNLSNKTVLVTGGTSFLGSHVVEKLKKRGAIPIVLKHKECDLTIWKQTKDFIDRCCPNYVIHCAGYNGGIEFNRRFPADILHSNTLMILNLIKACQILEVNKIVSVITSCAYADNGQPVFEEKEFWNGKPNPSVACHGYAKRMLDATSQMFHAQYGLNAVTACINNMYGPRDTFDPVKAKVVGSLIKKFTDAKNANSPRVECWGTGKPLREFVYVADAAELLIRTLERYEDHSMPLNISSTNEISIKDLSEMIAKLVGYEGEIYWDVTKGDGQMRKSLSTKRMKEWLGEFEFTSFENGLKEAINFYKATTCL